MNKIESVLNKKYKLKIGEMENKTIINIRPTFLLKGLKPAEIVENYRKGKYQDYQFPMKKADTKSVVRLESISYGQTPESDLYMHRNLNNEQQVIATTNHRAYQGAQMSKKYQTYTTKGEPIPENNECDFCRQKYTGETIGIPVSMKIDYRREGEVLKKLYIFYCDLCVYGHFECALAGIKREHRILFQNKNSLYLNSEVFLRKWHSLVYPGSELREALPYQLLKSNGGSLTESQYTNPKYTYQRIPHIIIAPVKPQYQQIAIQKQ